MRTYDRRMADSAGAFLIGELERLDPTINMPLAEVTWQRDIDLRDDIAMGDEAASFTVSTLAAPGSANSGINWIGKNSTAIAGIQTDIAKIPQPLHLWGTELSWSLTELASAAQVGRPIDREKFDGLTLKHQMDIDQLVYVGDTTVGTCGLTNNPTIPPYSLSCDWRTAPADAILMDVNNLIAHAWARSANALCPDNMRVPPTAFAGLLRPVSTAATMTILDFISKSCLAAAVNGRPMVIHPLKWLTDAGVAKKGRVVTYTRNKKYVRYPMVPMQKTALEPRSLYQLTTYFCKLGALEYVYQETVTYGDFS